jgi:TfoX/Sxy family transcriptional regulator of competence genes
MNQSSSDPEECFTALVEEFRGNPNVTPPETPASQQRFGSSGLRIHGRIFAMLAHGRLVVKLPKSRVDALVASGDGERFDAGKGRPMKEWLSLDPSSEQDWSVLAREALAFVAAER